MLLKYYGIPKDAGYGEKFMSRFPILFQMRKKSQKETCMCWGIEAPLGWYEILDQLCSVLEFHNMEFSKKYGIAIIAEQVKEKYGTLRFYFNVMSVDENGVLFDADNIPEYTPEKQNEIDIATKYLDLLANDIINEAEEMTANTCADCGTPLNAKNKVETQGWIAYICKDCDDKRNGIEKNLEESIEKESEKQ